MHYRLEEHFVRGENAVASGGNCTVGALADHFGLNAVCVLTGDDHLSGGRNEDVAGREHDVLAERRVRRGRRLEERTLAAVHACVRVALDRAALLSSSV